MRCVLFKRYVNSPIRHRYFIDFFNRFLDLKVNRVCILLLSGLMLALKTLTNLNDENAFRRVILRAVAHTSLNQVIRNSVEVPKVR